MGNEKQYTLDDIKSAFMYAFMFAHETDEALDEAWRDMERNLLTSDEYKAKYHPEVDATIRALVEEVTAHRRGEGAPELSVRLPEQAGEVHMSDVILVTIPLTQDELNRLRNNIVKRDAMISIGFDRVQLEDEIIARLVKAGIGAIGAQDE